MLNELVLAGGQHLLRQAPWACARLAEHAGKQVEVVLPLGTLLVRIAADGYVDRGDRALAPDLTIMVPPSAAAQWLVDRESAWREARIDGDSELAAAISFVVANLRWDYEADLSQVVGDIAAYRISQGVRRLGAWQADTAQSLARGVAEYLTEERQVLATPLGFEEFAAGVDELRDAAERLEKRIEKLAQRVAASSSQ
ncbi:MAG: sterol-binding protein [Burkholderiales bacterium]|jgi:ubiquinone biosynthesis protein UbiJ